MIRKYVLPLVAVRPRLRRRPASCAACQCRRRRLVAQPAKPPFSSYVAGAGIIEASSENIAVGSPVGGIVTEACT